MIGTDFHAARLGDARLRAAEFVGCVLRKADLTAADLTDVRATDSDFRDADLRNAVLEGANLGNCDLGGASLIGTQLRDAELSRTTGLLAGQLAAARTDDSTRTPAIDVIRNKIIGP